MDQHFHELLILKELNMSLSPNPWVQVLVLDHKVDIQPEKHLWFQITKDVLRHLSVLLSLRFVLLWALADLDPGRVKWCILVLPRAHQGYILKPIEAFKSAQLVQNCLLNLIVITHAQLSQWLWASPLFHEPHTCTYQLTCIVHVAQVRRWERDVSEKLIFVFF